LGVYDEAVTSLTKANALNPSDPTPDFLIARTYATVGEFTKAEQYAEQAVKDEPANPFWRGLLGVLYYRNFKYPEAITELGYVVNGGTLEDGSEIKPLELTNDPIIADYFVRYGLVLARSERCADALFVFQRILGQPGMDDNTIFNANEGIRICAERAGTPSAPAESTPENTPETLLEATPTP
jgi:tetratricopeptide (TPR) repeat protein